MPRSSGSTSPSVERCADSTSRSAAELVRLSERLAPSAARPHAGTGAPCEGEHPLDRQLEQRRPSAAERSAAGSAAVRSQSERLQTRTPAAGSPSRRVARRRALAVRRDPEDGLLARADQAIALDARRERSCRPRRQTVAP